MKRQAVRKPDDWYIKDADHLKSLNTDFVDLDYQILGKEYDKFDYKQLRELAIFENNAQKQNNTVMPKEKLGYRDIFRKKYRYENINNFADAVKTLT